MIVLYLHQAWVFVGGQTIDVMLGLNRLHLDEGGEAILDAVRAWILLPPVAHIYLLHLGKKNERERARACTNVCTRERERDKEGV